LGALILGFSTLGDDDDESGSVQESSYRSSASTVQKQRPLFRKKKIKRGWYCVGTVSNHFDSVPVLTLAISLVHIQFDYHP
jgi:hypothetical protein